MNAQTQTKQASLLMRKQRDVNPDWENSMERMKTDAAPTWVVDRVCQQMIDVNQHTKHHQRKGGKQFVSIETGSNRERYEEMQNDM